MHQNNSLKLYPCFLPEVYLLERIYDYGSFLINR